MSSLVTSTSAVPQSGLFAPRQQVFVVERSGNAPDDVTSSQFSQNGLHNVVVTAPRRDELANANLAVHDGPSRARIEIRSLDLGLTPAEVVGTDDVLQRFDNNGDGRVDLQESDKAVLARQSTSTFAAVGGTTPDTEAQAAPVLANTDAAPAQDDVPQADGTPEAHKFSAPLTPDGRPVAQKFADTANAATGAHTGTVAAPKKFYGQGAEAVAGPVVAHVAPAPTFHEKAAALKQQGVAREDGTGETRLYDKVAQSDTQHRGGHAGQDATLHEKARQIAAAINGSKKTVLVEVATYSANAALAARTKQAAILVESTDVTA